MLEDKVVELTAELKATKKKVKMLEKNYERFGFHSKFVCFE